MGETSDPRTRGQTVEGTGVVSHTDEEIFENSRMNPTHENSYGRGLASSFLHLDRVPRKKLCKGSDFVTTHGPYNSYISQGRDNLGDCWHGHGGAGHHESAAIDIVCGLQGKRGAEVYPNPIGDSSRIYLSQKADIDTYFGLADGLIGNKKDMSAIAIKSDAVRLIARGGGIKIVTGNAQNTKARSRPSFGKSTNSVLQTIESIFAERNSFGGFSMEPAPGIELIAGNNDERQKISFIGKLLAGMTATSADDEGEFETLQPIPLGDNLVKCLKNMVELISDLNGHLLKFVKYQSRFNSFNSKYIHSNFCCKSLYQI